MIFLFFFSAGKNPNKYFHIQAVFYRLLARKFNAMAREAQAYAVFKYCDGLRTTDMERLEELGGDKLSQGLDIIAKLSNDVVKTHIRKTRGGDPLEAMPTRPVLQAKRQRRDGEPVVPGRYAFVGGPVDEEL